MSSTPAAVLAVLTEQQCLCVQLALAQQWCLIAQKQDQGMLYGNIGGQSLRDSTFHSDVRLKCRMAKLYI